MGKNLNFTLKVFFIQMLFMASFDSLEYSPIQKFDKNTPKNINAKNLERLLSLPKDDTIRFVLSGDSQRAYDDLVPFVKAVNNIKGLDFLILNGDITDFGLLMEFERVHKILTRLNVPYIGIIGTHDLRANGLEIYKRSYSSELDFSFIYGGVKFICHNTNSREYNFNGTVPNLNWLKKELEPAADVVAFIAIAHVPPTSNDFDQRLFYDYGKYLTENTKVLALLNAHIDKKSIQYPFNDRLPVISTNSIYNRRFLIVEIVNNQFSYYEESF
jgi:Icc protein